MSHTKPLPERLRASADEVQSFPHPTFCDHLHVAHDVMREAAAALEAYDLGARSTAAQPVEQPSTMHDTTGTQALWPQMIAALAAIDAELGLPEDGCNSLTQTLAAIRKLKAAPPAASGDSTPPSAPVQGDPSGALRPEPEAAGHGSVEGDVRALRQMVADCEVYLKEGETPAQRIDRERRDTEAVLNLLIREKQRTEAMREVMLRMMAGIDHLAEIARQWEPDYSSGADRRGWVLAKDARDDAARLIAETPQAASGERGD